MAAWVLAALVALLLGLITLVIIGFGTGPVPFLIGLVVAALPVPVYVTLVLWIDRYEPEPMRMIVLTFAWGASIAAFVAIVLNTVGEAVVSENLGSDVAEIYGY